MERHSFKRGQNKKVFFYFYRAESSIGLVLVKKREVYGCRKRVMYDFVTHFILRMG